MDLLKFIFPFLFVRNWHTGGMELSRPRVVLFFGMVTLVVLGVSIAALLQTPVVYSGAS